MEKGNSLGQEHMLLLSVYSNALFHVTEEKKGNDKKSEVDLLKAKIKKGKKFIKINLDLVLIVALFFVFCYSTDIVTIKNYKHHMWYDLVESSTYSETFYKNISDQIKKTGQEFSYEPKQADFIQLKNVNNKMELSSWIYNSFIEKISGKIFVNSNILLGNCWRITVRSYKENPDSVSHDIYKYKKNTAIYSDSYFDEDIENDQSIGFTFLNSNINYPFSFEKTYNQLGGVYQIICSDDYNVIKEKLNQNTIYTYNYPYFVPAVLLTKVYTASVTIDFITYNPSLNILSYNILKFSFLPDIKMHKKIVIMSAMYNKFNLYSLIPITLFSLLLCIYTIKIFRKIYIVGFPQYFRVHYLRVFFTVSILVNYLSFGIYFLARLYLPDLDLKYENGSYIIDESYRDINGEAIETLFDDIHSSMYRIYIKEVFFVCTTAVSFVMCSLIFIKHFDVLIRKYNNVRKHIKSDVLYPSLLIVLFLVGCIFIFSIFEYKLFSISKSINDSILTVFVFNLGIIFANVNGFNISSVITEENLFSFFSVVPVLFIVNTISFSFILFLCTKSFIKRNKQTLEAFVRTYKQKPESDKKGDRNFLRIDNYSKNFNYLNEREKEKTKQKEHNEKGKEKTTSISISEHNINHLHKNEIHSEKLDIQKDSYTDNMPDSLQQSTETSKKLDDNYDSSENDELEKEMNFTNSEKQYSEKKAITDSSNFDSSSESEKAFLHVNTIKNETANFIKNIDGTRKDKIRETKEKMNEEKGKSYFKLEKYLDFFFNRKENFLPLSYIEKKNVLKQYKLIKYATRKKKFFIMYTTILVLFIILIQLLSENKRIFEADMLLGYQIRNISYISKNNSFEKMEYFHFNKNLNIDIKKKKLTFETIEKKIDVSTWLKTCFLFYIQNNSEMYDNETYRRNQIDVSSLFKWNEIFVFNQEEGIHIYIHSTEEMLLLDPIASECDSTRTYCTIQIRQNTQEQLIDTLNSIATIINQNDAVDLITIHFILSDKHKDHNVLIKIQFNITPNGFISKNLDFLHLFFNHFRIYAVKGIIIHLVCLLIFLFDLVFIYYSFYQNLKIFYRQCYKYLYSSQNVKSPTLNKGIRKSVPQKKVPHNYYNKRIPFRGNYSENVHSGIHHKMNNPNYMYNSRNQGLKKRTETNAVPTMRRRISLNFRIFTLFLFEGGRINFFIFPLYISLFVFWFILSYYINLLLKDTLDVDSGTNIHLKLFTYVTYFLRVSYLCIFFTIGKLFTFLSTYFKKEILYDALYRNKKQIVKFFFLITYFYITFTLYTYFFYGIETHEHFSFREYLFYSLLIGIGIVNAETYLKANTFYFLLIVLPYVMVLRFLFIYTFISPIMTTCIVLLKSKRKTTSIVNQKNNLIGKDNSSSNFDYRKKSNNMRKKKNKHKEQKYPDPNDFVLTRLSNEQWNTLNDEIKQFAIKETEDFFHFFEQLKKESEQKTSSVLLKETNEKLNQKLLSTQTALRKIELHLNFHNKILASEMSDLEKLNRHILELEEIIEQKKNYILSYQQQLHQLQKET